MTIRLHLPKYRASRRLRARCCRPAARSVRAARRTRRRSPQLRWYCDGKHNRLRPSSEASAPVSQISRGVLGRRKYMRRSDDVAQAWQQHQRAAKRSAAVASRLPSATARRRSSSVRRAGDRAVQRGSRHKASRRWWWSSDRTRYTECPAPAFPDATAATSSTAASIPARRALKWWT